MGLISGLFGYMSASETNETNIANVRRTNETNLKLAREQNAFNERMWNLNNEYNEPAKQAQRLRAAGLSDAAAAGSVSGNQSQPIQSAELANQVAPQVSPIDPSVFQSANIIGLMREFQALKKETAEAKEQEVKSEFSKPMLFTDLDAKRWANRLSMQSFEQSALSFPYHVRSLYYKMKTDKIGVKAAELGIKEAKINLKLAKQQFGFLEEKNKKDIEKLCEEISNIQKTGKNIEKQGELLDAQVQNVQASTTNIQAGTEKTKEETQGVKTENKLKNIEYVLKKFGYPDTVTQRIASLIVSNELSDHELKQVMFTMVDYLQSGGKIFDGDDNTRIFWEKVMNEGQSKEEQLAPWTQLWNSWSNSYRKSGN